MPARLKLHCSLLALAGALALAAPVAASGDAGAGQAAQAAPRFVDHVGRVADSRLFIAVSIERPGGSGRVEVYACDDRRRWHRLLGTSDGQTIALQARGVAVQAAVAGDTVTGTLTTDRQRPFTARAARTRGGLYTITNRRGYRVTGTSLGGSRLALRADPRTRRFRGSVRTAAGRSHSLRGRFRRSGGRIYRQYRWVLLDSGELRGARKAGSKTTSGSGFIDPTVDE